MKTVRKNLKLTEQIKFIVLPDVHMALLVSVVDIDLKLKKN